MSRNDRNINALVTLAQDIVNTLTQLDARPWSVERNQHDNGVDIVSAKDTTRLYVRFDWQNDGRLVISPDNADLREHGWYNDPTPSISVSEARGGNAIAKDIERRLLDDARDLRLKLLDRKAKHDAHEGRTERLARKMAAAARQNAPSKDNRSGYWGFEMRQTGWARQVYAAKASVSVSVNEHDGRDYERVKVELSDLTPEMAERVLALAAQFIK